jgi:aspartyl aminopeptidase
VTIDSLLDDIDHSATPSHLVHLWRTRLQDHGFHELQDAQVPDVERGFLARSGVLLAWKNTSTMGQRGIRILGAHTDSPGLHLKPSLVRKTSGTGLLSVEVYGSPILSSWFDRDLSIAGTATFRDGSKQLFHLRDPLARFSHLAIHLDREINDRGHVIDRHRHLAPIWSTDPADLGPLIAAELGVQTHQIESLHAQLVDTQPPARFGRQREFISSPRLDNQVSCWAAMHALLDDAVTSPSVVALYDHEEVGSSSSDGASGPLLERVLERISLALGLSRDAHLVTIERSSMLSMDNCHAVHPNHQDRHDLDNAPVLGGGVAVKANSNQRYATSGRSLSLAIAAAQSAGLQLQSFSSRNDVPCGSTIGPLTATRVGIDTVDVGVPQLAMHSVREMCHVDDALSLPRLAAAYLRR